MAEEDRARWDERYKTGDWANTDKPARILEDAEAWLSPPGLALDVACGAGRNALWLARRGFTVFAVDISREGLERLRRRARDERLDIHLVQADLERFAFPGDKFDLIVNTRFLLRSLFPAFRGALKPGGLLLLETFSVDEIETLGGGMRRDHTLERGEVGEVFGEFEVLLYEEGTFEECGRKRGLVRFVGRKHRGA
jgi:SAM-dependent methyltransferase